MITPEELQRRMGYHPVTGPQQAAVYDENRTRFIALAQHIVDTSPEGREQSLALTALQDALMWTNAAVACKP